MTLLLFLYAWCAAVAGTLSVEVLDVGQGDSILLRTPEGRTVLIDGGTGRRNVVSLLERRGISSIDLMVNTHAHADHLGGLDEVLEAMPVEVYIDSGMPHTTESYAKVIRLVEAKGIRYKAVRGGQVFRFDDGITMRVLAPYDPLLRGTRSDLNSNSVITRIEHGDVCFLMMGDAELETEHQVLEHGLEPCEVLKVAHHGSAYASSNAFLEAAQPEWAAISAGRNNRYKHPAPETLRRLEKSGAKVLRTDLHGRILFESDGRNVTVAAAVNPPDAPLPAGVTHRPVGGGVASTAMASASTNVVPPAAPSGRGEGSSALATTTAPAPVPAPTPSVAPAKAVVASPTPAVSSPTRAEAPRTRAERRQQRRRMRELRRAGGPSVPMVSDTAGPTGTETASMAPAPAVKAPAPTSAGKFDLNTASRDQLMSVPGIGPTRADAILAYRNAHGAFASLEAVDDVSGIGPATVQQLGNHAFVR